MSPKLNNALYENESSKDSFPEPSILHGKSISPMELPADFDFTYHRKVLASGKVRATTSEEFADMIAELKQKLRK